MAINTATIQHRRGSLDDFNPEKLTPGELAVITDERSVYMGFPGGEAEKIVLEKDFTSESIKEKLGYEPADEERVDQLFRDKADYQYVDEKVSNVKVDLTGYAKEDYVDAEIEELNEKIVQETGKLSNEIEDVKCDLESQMKKVNNIVGDYLYDTMNNFIVGSSIDDSSNFTGSMYAISPLINVKGGDILRLRTFYGSAAKYGFADADKKVIVSGSLVDSDYKILNTWVSDNTLVVPNNAVYFRFFGRKCSSGDTNVTDIKDFSVVTFNRNMTSEFVDSDKIEIPNLINHSTQWNGKICACIGSSLTANGGWTDVIKNRFGFEKVYNRGTGGTTLADFSDYSGITGYVGGYNIYTDTDNYDEERTSVFCDDTSTATRPYEYRIGAWYSSEMRINLLPTDADLIIVDLATNDFYRSFNKDYVSHDDFLADQTIKTVYGESINNFNYDTSKLFGAFMMMVKRIMGRCPNAKIVVWGMLYNSTINSDDSESLSYYIRMIDKIKYMCRLTGVYFIDTMNEMGVNIWNSADIIQDGVHPYTDQYTNEKGKYLVANVLTSHLNNLYPNN